MIVSWGYFPAQFFPAGCAGKTMTPISIETMQNQTIQQAFLPLAVASRTNHNAGCIIRFHLYNIVCKIQYRIHDAVRKTPPMMNHGNNLDISISGSEGIDRQMCKR
jgi:hypothetical protein